MKTVSRPGTPRRAPRGFAVRPGRFLDPRASDPEAVYPANRQETLPIALMSLTVAFLALAVSAKQGYMMLYGDAVAHLGIARRIVDNTQPGFVQLGSPWLPLPHLLMVPLVWKMEWWQDGMAGAWPSMICFVLAVCGVYRLARRMMPATWAFVSAAFFGLNANLLYLATTPMTEPLFLAILVWSVLVLCELAEALREQRTKAVRDRLLLLGLLNFAGVMTRYDGWILAFAIWCIVSFHLFRERKALRGPGIFYYILFTLLTVAGPLLWFWYNHVFGHDWLDFMRGPYSAKEIDRRTSPPGSHHHFGYHAPAWALLLYLRTAQVDTAAWETGFLVFFGSAWATWEAWRRKLLLAPRSALLLLWLPVPFYVYSVSYGSVPIFIPQLYPRAFYNSRYGVEMLPAFTLFTAFALYLGTKHWKAKRPELVKFVQPAALIACVLNLLLMLHSIPLVLKEGMINSQARMSVEIPLAEQLAMVPRGEPILMDNSDFVGALQMAGIPLKQTIGPADYYHFHEALADPAHKVAAVITSDGDAISKALGPHPAGLTEEAITCVTHQACLHVYRSRSYGAR